MTAETKDFSLGVALSLTTGYMLAGNFGEIHEAAEWLVGHPIWTHEFADRALADRLRDMILGQRPELAAADDFRAHADALKGASKSAARSHVDSFMATQVERFGAVVALAKGGHERAESPLDTLRRMVPDEKIVVVTVAK